MVIKMDKNDKNKVNYEKLNETITLSNKILKLFYILTVVGIVVLAIMLGRTLGIFKTIGNVLAVCAPFFLGVIIAWMLDPIVSWLQKHKVKRGIATILVFLAFILILVLLGWLVVPMLITQINEFVKALPSLILEIANFIHEMFAKFSNLGIDLTNIENNVYKTIETFGLNLTESLPTTIVNVASGTITSIGTLLLGIVVGFYLLLDFGNVKYIMDFIPKKFHENIMAMITRFNGAFRKFIQGMLVVASFVSLISTIGYWIIGLPSPLLFGIVCGITNIIPYIGPWIGGAICVIVGFTVSPLVGVLAAIVALIVQQLDNIVLEPLIYGKTMKLHPVTIMIGLLVFGYFFGVFGMIIATPILACLKMILNYFDEKYELVDKIVKANGNVKRTKTKKAKELTE